MGMLLTSYTISNKAEIASQTNGRETGRTILSSPGIEARLVLSPDQEFKLRDELGFVHISLSAEMDRPPNLNATDFQEWLRVRLVGMLGGIVPQNEDG